jgi:hypothetical protein
MSGILIKNGPAFGIPHILRGRISSVTDLIDINRKPITNYRNDPMDSTISHAKNELINETQTRVAHLFDVPLKHNLNRFFRDREEKTNDTSKIDERGYLEIGNPRII